MSQASIRQPVPVGKYFLDQGKISPQQLDLALKHRAEFGLKLGQSLVELGFVTEADMVEALRHQARFPCIHLTPGVVEARVAAKVGVEVSRRLHGLALNQIAGHTTVAMEDPTDEQALLELSHVLGTRIFPVYAQPTTIQRLLDHVFGAGKGGRPPRPAASPAAPPASGASAPAAAPQPAATSEPAVPPALPATSTHEHEHAPAPDAPPDERAVVDRVRGFLLRAFEHGISDIHLEARRDELCVRFRVDGILRMHTSLPAPWVRPTIACLKALAKIDGEGHAPREGSVPFVFKKQPIEVRIATTPSLHGESAVLRVKGTHRPRRELAQLGLAEEQLSELGAILDEPGLVLVTGPAGSGRSSTLEALLVRLATPERKAVALVSHVERELEGVLHVEVDPRAGLGYAAGARALLGQDPDVLLVQDGDTRETARCLLDAALSGRFVLTTMRSRGALEALLRCVQLGLEPYLLSEALRAVITQRLVRRICGGCKAASVPDEMLRASLGLSADGAPYYEGEGCEACQGSGYQGRVGLFEVLRMSPALRRELERGSDLEALARAACAEGFQTLREHGLRQARAGSTTLHEVLTATAGA